MAFPDGQSPWTRQQQQQHRRHNKRDHHQHQHDDQEEEFVDDLTVAAQYAFAVPSSSAALLLSTNTDTEMCNENDENEIDLEEDETSLSLDEMNPTSSGDEMPAKHEDGDQKPAISDVSNPTNESSAALSHRADTNDTNDDDDAESDVDLTEQLARMVDAEGDDVEDEVDGSVPSAATSGVIKRPMTANEIDVYRVDLKEIQEKLMWSATITDEAKTLGSSNDGGEWDPNQLTRAGTVQHYMADERTVVILSQPGGVLLQEGTLLLFQTADVAYSDGIERQREIVPIGKILEVFGPVSQPLYSILLPIPSLAKSASSSQSQQSQAPQEKSDEADATAIDSTESAAAPLVKSDETDKSGNDNASAQDESPTMETPEFIELESEKSSADTSIPTRLNAAPPDPWSKHGRYSVMLKSNPKLPVYFLQDSSVTSVLDTATVYRQSGRGCDASNVFDEEAVDAQDYSDDEEERLAKGQNRNRAMSNRGGGGDSVGGRGGRGEGGRGGHGNTHRGDQAVSGRDHHQARRDGYPPPHHHRQEPSMNRSSDSRPLPVTSYSPPQSIQPQTWQTPYPQGFHTGAAQYVSYLPPPPPPPPQQHAHMQHHYYASSTHVPMAQPSYLNQSQSQMPVLQQQPPPPPPPPPEQQDDTVYYDFS